MRTRAPGTPPTLPPSREQGLWSGQARRTPLAGGRAAPGGDHAVRTLLYPRMLVVQTFLVGRVSPHHYEVHIAADEEPDAKRVVLLTQDAQLYADALDLENTGQRVHVRAHHARRMNGQPYDALDDLEPA
jgi:hypothetical protein